MIRFLGCAVMGLGVLSSEVLSQADPKKDDKAPSLEETLAWMKKLPPLAKMPDDQYTKLTLEDLKVMTDFSYGGHTKAGPHVATPAGEFRYLTALPALQKLDLMENDGIDDEALSHIGKIKALTHLTLGGGGGRVTGAGLKHLENQKGLVHLFMPGSCTAGDLNAGLGSLAKLPQLEVLHLGNDKITDQGLMLMAKATKLKELSLPMNPNITDAGLLSLKSIKTLTVVKVDKKSKVTPQGIAQLQKAVPNCKVAAE